ncbi:MAG: MCP four helix bundle domain-containing protein, partial [Fulvivirga sp.]|uniref:MCP four helix bundle domain-containing protein n=1 Tax=Fulvivirga sp. TaxID=1931237 RepID=UPI0032EC83B6
VFIILLITNLLDSSNSGELKNSFTTFYKDRLVVEGYIYKLSNAFNDKKDLILNPGFKQNQELSYENASLNISINKLIKLYEGTILTKEEERYFEQLKTDVNRLYDLENYYLYDGKPVRTLELEAHFPKLFTALDKLSEIQLEEGKNIIDNSSQLLASSNLTSKLEICLLIVVGLIIQAIIFSAKSLTPRINQKGHLN